MPTTPAATIDADIQVDVLDVSDLRFEGGTSGSVAEEVRAQAAAGYSTALLHLNGPLLARTSPFNPAIRRCVDEGLARLVFPHQRVRAKVVVVRHPAVLQHAAADLRNIETDKVIIVANAAPRDIDGFEHYNIETVRRAALERLGVEPVWAPIGPLVRQAIADDLEGRPVVDADWVNIIDVAAWYTPREDWVSTVPVIGRHSRDSPQKWPADSSTLTNVYPVDGSMRVRILGGAAPAKELIGDLPDSWRVFRFGAKHPRDFLTSIDFFVYFHNPRWVEAFGRTILEALASGVVAVLPEHFRTVFGEGALYATPDEVQPLIQELYRDREAYEAQARKGVEIARERFGHEAHINRLTTLIGPPSDEEPDGESTTPHDQQAPALTTTRSSDECVLMISSNGSGMGHLTRLLAMARRLPDGLTPRFLSLSQAVPAVGRFGYEYEYMPSMGASGLDPTRWHEYFRLRVREALDRLRPAAVVFDGTAPYEGIPRARRRAPDVPWIWSRRGMWYKGHNRDQLAKADWFDLVIEPGDFAAAADRGVTADAPSTRVDPVTLLDASELTSRADAREALGLSPDRTTALVTLGAGNINDAHNDATTIIETLRGLDLDVCVTRADIAERATTAGRDVFVTSEYPLSKHYRAFDLAVSASGYNSFHELLRFGVPTLFVPNTQTSLDDQRARAHYAGDHEWAHWLDHPETHTVRKLTQDLLENGRSMVATVGSIDPGNGAYAAADAIARLARGRVV